MIHGWYRYFAQMSVIIAVDRVLKWWALSVGRSEYPITGWLSCHLMFNRGISWSMFDSDSFVQFTVVSMIVMAVTGLLIWHAYQQYAQGYTITAEVAVIAGSLSNLIDRYVYGGVIDFIMVHYQGWVYPVFNIADGAIVLGVMYMGYAHWKKP